MFGWYRRYKEMKREHAELLELCEVQRELLALRAGIVDTLEKRVKVQERHLALSQKVADLAELEFNLAMANLAMGVYSGGNSRQDIANIFKALKPERCKAIVALMTIKKP